MHRSYDLRHHRKSTTTGKSNHLFFISRNKLVNNRNTCRVEQCLHIMRLDISICRNRVNDATNTGNIHTKKFNLIRCRPRCIYNARQSRTKCHFICKVHMPFGKKSCHFCPCRINRRKNRENRLTASLHLFVQYIVHFKHSH